MRAAFFYLQKYLCYGLSIKNEHAEQIVSV